MIPSQSLYNIIFQGIDDIIVWNILRDKVQIINRNSPLYKFYDHGNNCMAARQEVIGDDEIGLILMQKSLGFLKDVSLDEQKQAELKLLNKRISDSLSIVLTTTFSCNFGCSYCCQGTDKESGVFDKSTIQKVISLWQESKKQHLSIVWYGGEPLLASNKIISASKEIKESIISHGGNYKAELYTNGYLLSPKVVTSLYHSGISKYQISLDGCKSNHDRSRAHLSGKGTYDKIFENIREVNDLDLPIQVVVRINIDSDNADIEALINDLLQQQANQLLKTRFYLAPIENRMGTTQDNIQDKELISRKSFAEKYIVFLQICRKHSINYFIPDFTYGTCTATRKDSFVLAPNGDMHKCWDTVALPSESYGNLNNIEDDYGVTKENARKWLNFSAKTHHKCRSCKLLPICGGSCAVKHFTQSENDVKEYFHKACPPNKFLLKEYICDRINRSQQPMSALSSKHYQDIPLQELSIQNDVHNI